MKKIYILFFALVMTSFIANAQLANWTPFVAGTAHPIDVSGQINGACRITDLIFHPTNPNKFYAITAEGGLYLSVNQGNNWTLAPGTKNMIGSHSSLCVDRTNDQNLLLGAGDENYYLRGGGILRSTNGGNSFVATGLTTGIITDILQSPTNASHFVASTSQGILKSTDGGLSWAATTAVNIQFVHLVRNVAANSQILYAATKEPNSRLFRSTDFGSTWTHITTGITMAVNNLKQGGRIAVTQANPNVVYFEKISGGGMIFKSLDGGLTFTQKKGDGLPNLVAYDITNAASTSQGNYNNALCVDNTNASKIWLHSQVTTVSLDDGATWTMQTNWWEKLHSDMHELKQSPFNSNHLYSVNDGGVYLSTDGGVSWIPKTNGMYAYEIYPECAASSRIVKDYMNIGTQDNGRLFGNNTQWTTTRGGDDNLRRRADYNGYTYYTGNNNIATHRELSPNPTVATFGTALVTWNDMAFNRSNVNLGFIATDNIFRSIDLNAATPTWTQISNFSTDIQALHSCIADPNKLYVLLKGGDVYICNNALAANPTYTLSTTPTFATNAGSIVAMANNPNIVYFHGQNEVYRSGDGGLTWVDNTFNLPNVNHRNLLVEETSSLNELVFIATNNAVYYKTAGQMAWTNYSTNLPARRAPTTFTMYDDGTPNSRIRYTSYGMAVYETPFANLRGAPLATKILEFDATCLSNSIQVDWKTENDDPAKFILEKSNDGSSWDDLYVLDVVDKKQAEYRFIDKNYDKAYYRLKILDQDATKTYSNVIIANCKTKEDKTANGVIAYPIPFTDILNLNIDEEYGCKIYGTNGRLMYQGSDTQINTSSWASGIYFLKTPYETLKLLKE